MGSMMNFIHKLTGKNAPEKQCISVSVATNVGSVREVNEDNFYADRIGVRRLESSAENRLFKHSDRYVFAVCDGMGGEAFGDTASEIAVSALSEYAVRLKKTEPEGLPELVNEYASEANNRICKMVDDRKASLSGSTLAMVCTVGKLAYIFNIGDSRVYYYCGGKLTQVTEDQTLAVKKLKANIYTEEEAKLSEDAHKLTSFLGVDSRGIGLKALRYEPVDLEKGLVLICSDGLTDMCSDEEIAELLSRNDECSAGLLADRACRNGGHDNVTCIVIKAL